MTQVQPAFWVRYRGDLDPQIPNNVTYTYAVTAYTNGTNVVLLSRSFSAQGPPQLTKQRYMEISWSPMVGMNRITISRNGTPYFASNGAEGGFRDEGQFTTFTGGVTNQ